MKTIKVNDPIFESPLGIASDPSVIRIDKDTLHLYYTAENFKICLAISMDNGASWQSVNEQTNEDFGVIQGQPNRWDKNMETVKVLKVGSEYWMYYTGYREGESDNPHVENFQVGLAISTDGGFTFNRHPICVDSPIIPINLTDDNAMDRHAITSPSVVLHNGLFHMIYTGWNTTNDFSGADAGLWTMAATSSDGVNWEKETFPLITLEDVPWTEQSIDESDIFRSSDGTWYFTFSAKEGVGLATASDFFGPYTALDEPLFSKEHSWEKAEIIAPNLLIENGLLMSESVLRIWYVGIETDAFFPAVIGYAECAIPN